MLLPVCIFLALTASLHSGLVLPTVGSDVAASAVQSEATVHSDADDDIALFKSFVTEKIGSAKVSETLSDLTLKEIRSSTKKNPSLTAVGPSSPNTTLATEAEGSDSAPQWQAHAQSGCRLQPRKFMIAVVTSPEHFRARAAIRSTWGGEAKDAGVDVKFFIGQLPEHKKHLEEKLREESGDVVRLTDFTEHYHNLTAKAIGIFSYAYDNCMGGVFKVDDDTFVRVRKFLEFLTAQPDWQSLYAGAMTRDSSVIKDPKGRWYAYDQYPHEKWPTFANGPGFFLGYRGLQLIANNRDSLNKIRIDDAAVGVWTEPLKLNVVDMPTSIYEFDPSSKAVIQNPVNPEEMFRLKRGDHFTPSACHDDQEFACLCTGNPRFTGRELGECWEHAGRIEYVDHSLRA